MLPCIVWEILSKLFTAYMLIMIVYAVVSWIPSIRGRWSDYLAMAVEPALAPGKTTLSDRLLEFTKTVQNRDMEAQLLDAMDLERERGITIKMHPVTLTYIAHTGIPS